MDERYIDYEREWYLRFFGPKQATLRVNGNLGIKIIEKESKEENGEIKEN